MRRWCRSCYLSSNSVKSTVSPPMECYETWLPPKKGHQGETLYLEEEIVKGLDSCFSNFNSNPIIQAMSRSVGQQILLVWLSLAMTKFVCWVRTSFTLCNTEPELKVCVREVLSAEPIKFSTCPACVHEYEEHPALSNVLALLQIVFSIPVQTSTLELGCSVMKQIKTDWHNMLSSQTLSKLVHELMIKLDGPDLITLMPNQP